MLQAAPFAVPGVQCQMITPAPAHLHQDGRAGALLHPRHLDAPPLLSQSPNKTEIHMQGSAAVLEQWPWWGFHGLTEPVTMGRSVVCCHLSFLSREGLAALLSVQTELSPAPNSCSACIFTF